MRRGLQRVPRMRHAHDPTCVRAFQVDRHQAAGSENAKFSLGVVELKYLLDFTSMGFDVLFFEPHRIFFTNPLPLLYGYVNSTGADILLPSSSCVARPLSPASPLQREHVHLVRGTRLRF